ncbi:uncharacterized [Tachysurus ichikawai]
MQQARRLLANTQKASVYCQGRKYSTHLAKPNTGMTPAPFGALACSGTQSSLGMQDSGPAGILSKDTGTEGPHFEMAGIQLAVQLRATYQHFGPPAECAVSLNAFTKPAACGMTTRMCSGLTVLLFLKPPFLKLTCFAFNFQPWIAVIRIDFPHEFK